MDGGRVLVPLRVDRARARAALGSVASALFSCSSLASKKAVDCDRCQNEVQISSRGS